MEFGATHSSSQRRFDTIGNTPPPSCQSPSMTPAGSPPPAGVIICARRMARPPFPGKILRRCVDPRKVCAIRAPDVERMQATHGCHSDPALFYAAAPSYISLIGRATISSSQRPRQDRHPSSSQVADRDQKRPPDLLPGGRFFLHCTQPEMHTGLNLCGQKPGFWPEFCQNFCLTCAKRMGAVLEQRFSFRRRSVYSVSSDQGGAKDERPPSTKPKKGVIT
ncbi:hypothetical protein J2Y63_001371 [Shinella sp. BE166]